MTARERVDIERGVYAAGNPHVYEPVPAESAYTELDREHSRRLAELARLRGELFDVRAALKRAELRVWGLGIVVGLYTVGALMVAGILLVR